MRKRYLLPVGLVLALIIFGAISCDFAPPPTSAPRIPSVSGSLSFSQQNTGIWVNGEGKVTVVPDVAILNLGVESQAATVAAAQNEAATAMNAVVTELKSRGVADKDVKTQRFSIEAVRRFERDREILIGYRVTNMVTAKVRKIDDTGPIIDAVTRVGGDNIRIRGISFTVDDPAPFKKEAREKAMADAAAKARQLAELGGVRLGKPTYINESGGFISPPIPFVREFAPVPAPAPAPPPTIISPGETEIQLNVQVVYSIQ